MPVNEELQNALIRYERQQRNRAYAPPAIPLDVEEFFSLTSNIEIRTMPLEIEDPVNPTVSTETTTDAKVVQVRMSGNVRHSGGYYRIKNKKVQIGDIVFIAETSYIKLAQVTSVYNESDVQSYNIVGSVLQLRS